VDLDTGPAPDDAGHGEQPGDRRAQLNELGERLSRGDDSALEDCYAALGPTVLAYLRRQVGPDEAEDVLQRVFLEVWRAADRFDPRQSLSGWVFTIARRRAIDTLRARKPAVVSVDVLRDLVGEDGREVADRYAWAADVRAAMAQLPQTQRRALELANFEDRTQQEIAAALEVPIGTVKSRLARGGRALAQLLRPTTVGTRMPVTRTPVTRMDEATRGGEAE
jgi:RNA polymerase sigma-70 factor (ECF subfamily)